MRKLILIAALVAILIPSAAIAAPPYPGQPTAPEPLVPDIADVTDDYAGLWVHVEDDAGIWLFFFDEPLPYAESWQGYTEHKSDRESCLWGQCDYETVTYVYDDFTYWGFFSYPGMGPYDGYWAWYGGKVRAGSPMISNNPNSPYYGYQYVNQPCYLNAGTWWIYCDNTVYTYEHHWNWMSLLLNLFGWP